MSIKWLLEHSQQVRVNPTIWEPLKEQLATSLGIELSWVKFFDIMAAKLNETPGLGMRLVREAELPTATEVEPDVVTAADVVKSVAVPAEEKPVKMEKKKKKRRRRR